MKKPFSIEKKHDELDAAEMMARPEVARAVASVLVDLKCSEINYPEWPGDAIGQIHACAGHISGAYGHAVGLRGKGACERELMLIRIAQAAAACIRCLINLEGTPK